MNGPRKVAATLVIMLALAAFVYNPVVILITGDAH